MYVHFFRLSFIFLGFLFDYIFFFIFFTSTRHQFDARFYLFILFYGISEVRFFSFRLHFFSLFFFSYFLFFLYQGIGLMRVFFFFFIMMGYLKFVFSFLFFFFFGSQYSRAWRGKFVLYLGWPSYIGRISEVCFFLFFLLFLLVLLFLGSLYSRRISEVRFFLFFLAFFYGKVSSFVLCLGWLCYVDMKGEE